MVEETIQSIRETEARAEEIVREAEQKSRMILEEAGQKAEKTAAGIISRAKTEALKTAEQAKDTGDREAAAEMAEAEKEMRALKTAACEKEEEAVSLVIALLTEGRQRREK